MLVAYGRYTADAASARHDVIYIGEGMNASVAVSRAAERRPQLPQRRQGPGVERAAGHAAAADARPPHDARARERRSRCWSSAAAPASRPARSSIDPARRAARRSPRSSRSCRASSPTYFARAQLRRRPQPEGRTSQIDDARHFLLTTEREVRRHHVRSARSVGEGRGDALHARVLRARQGAPEPGRRRDAVRAAVREQHRGGEERDRDVLRGVPERR